MMNFSISSRALIMNHLPCWLCISCEEGKLKTCCTSERTEPRKRAYAAHGKSACERCVRAKCGSGSRNREQESARVCFFFFYGFVPETNNKPACLCLCGRDVGVALITFRFPCGIGSKSPPPLPFSNLMQDTLLFD